MGNKYPAHRSGKSSQSIDRIEIQYSALPLFNGSILQVNKVQKKTPQISWCVLQTLVGL